MKTLATLLLAFALASPALDESRAQSEATFNNNSDSWAVGATATIAFDSNLPRGDNPESTRILTYLSSLKDFSDIEANSVFIPGVLGFINSREESSHHSYRRELSSDSVSIENIGALEIFSLLFRAFSVRSGELEGNNVELSYVRLSNSLDTNASLLSRDEPDLMLGFFYRALKMGSNYDDSDLKLKDARYTLD